MKTLLIGQAPGPKTDPDMPLYPYSRSSTGGRLVELMGISTHRYLEEFDRVNLLRKFPGRHKNEDKFPTCQARVAADAMSHFLAGRTVVFVGRNVSDSFGYLPVDAPFHQWSFDRKYRFHFAVIPHPSGRSRWYNSPQNREISHDFWRRHLGLRNNVIALAGRASHA